MALPDTAFRAGVGAAVLNAARNVLVLERSDTPGSWQLPQGGLRAGEEPLDAVHRELEEETGLGRIVLELVGQLPEPLAASSRS
jgi:putative (di)nucleoside polyphosphate hydrolase